MNGPHLNLFRPFKRLRFTYTHSKFGRIECRNVHAFRNDTAAAKWLMRWLKDQEMEVLIEEVWPDKY